MRDCYQKITAAEGLKGFYRGACITVFEAAAFRGLYFGLLSSGKPYYAS